MAIHTFVNVLTLKNKTHACDGGEEKRDGKGSGGERCVSLGWKGRHSLAVVVAAERGGPCG